MAPTSAVRDLSLSLHFIFGEAPQVGKSRIHPKFLPLTAHTQPQVPLAFPFKCIHV